MAVKLLGWKDAARALRASGLGAGSLLGLWWPLGRESRARAMLCERRAVLEAKNQVMDYLFRAQRPLAALQITRPERLQEALQDREKRRLIMSLGVSRGMVEEVLLSRYGGEMGKALDRALGELAAAGLIMRVAAQSPSAHEVYIAVPRATRPQFDLSALNRLLQEGRDLGNELKSRLSRQETTNGTRTHKL